ncbi:unnamed protein product [Larinioides sclopetarius]|uniref:Uncharacterized protein n=1 Tax=Larinioides sclopetarius TaxID=280406 RepID=A0AAV2BJ60_9ARAC
MLAYIDERFDDKFGYPFIQKSNTSPSCPIKCLKRTLPLQACRTLHGWMETLHPVYKDQKQIIVQIFAEK